MHILWFTNDPMPAVNRRYGRPTAGTGHWIPELLASLLGSSDLQIEVATVYPGLRDEQFEEDGVRYFVVGQPKTADIFFHCRLQDLQACADLVRQRKPDLVHIHGTERFYGLLSARKLIDTPVVISLQGLLNAYQQFFFGALSFRDIWKSNRLIELGSRRGLYWQHREYRRGARQEQEILSGAAAFLGRTDWDRAYVYSANPNASYYHVGEVLRQSFRSAIWDVSKCDRHTVIFTNCGHPRRGTETLLDAIPLICRAVPDLRVRLAGHIGSRRGYERFLRRCIAGRGLSDRITLLGYLDAQQMAQHLSSSHVFAISSYSENSPNSLCEAMQVGMPVVASYAGGIPSLVRDGHTGLLFPPGDAAMLADAIVKIFREDALACKLGQSARIEASARHDPNTVTADLLSAYNNVAALRRLGTLAVSA
jgi:glycosyltransferase involved in cell wall biosynthesis